MKKVILVFILFAPPVFAASFDCNKASTVVEKAICNNEKLSKLDDTLARTFKVANNDDGHLLTSQKQWLSIRNQCTDDKCLIDSYSKRIAEIEASKFGGRYEGNNLSMTVRMLDNDTASVEMVTGNQECTGEIAGKGHFVKNVLKFQSQTKEDGAENCVVSVTFGDKSVEVLESEGCSVFHGLNCSFNDTLHRVK